jgi:hypothetical protein
LAVAIPPEQISSDAARLPIHEIVAFLRQKLGRTTIAYISGVKDPKMVSHWMAGQHAPRDVPQMRLRESYHAARLVIGAFDAATAKAWFFSSNAELNDRAPAYVIRTARSWEEMRTVVPAARAFTQNGTSEPPTDTGRP